MCRLCVSVDDLSRPAWSNGKISLVMLATQLALSLSPSVTPISAPGFGGGTWPHKVTHDDDRKLFVMRGQHGTGRVPKGCPSRRAPSGGMLACTEKSRWHSSARRRRRRPTYVPRGGRARGSASRERLHPHATCRTSRPRPLVVEVQLAERHVRSRACHVDVEVARARTAVRGATQRSIGLRKAIKKASLEHALACATKSAHAGASPSVARACLAMRLSSPQFKPSKIALLACVHHGQIDRVGSCRIVCWYARRRCAGTRVRGSCRGLGSQPSRLDCESGLSGGSEDARCFLLRR